jgi:hypothetical protein
MDFVEKIFGIAPDLGSGVLEVSILLAVATLISVRMLRKKTRRLRWR